MVNNNSMRHSPHPPPSTQKKSVIKVDLNVDRVFERVCLPQMTDTHSGILIDYTLHVGILYSYTAELRGNGFVVSPSEIQPSFEEIWNGTVAMRDEVASIEGLP